MIRPHTLDKFIAKYLSSKKSLVYRHSDRVVKKALKDPEFPVLVSFPRTGSHWLRMMMEIYFHKPSLPRIFYFKKSRSYSLCHVHDLKDRDRIAGVERNNVLYLYRNAPETIHSILEYYTEPMDSVSRIEHWTDVYAQHLSKWLLNETFTKKKTLLKYENFHDDPIREFEKVCNHLGKPMIESEFRKVYDKVSREKIQAKTPDNRAIIKSSHHYHKGKQEFLDQHSDRIQKYLFTKEPRIKHFFPEP